MMSNVNCSVPNCTSVKKKRFELSFHKFPAPSQTIWVKDEFGNWEKQRVSRRQLWIKALKIKRDVSNTMKVCSLHFLPEDFYTKNTYKLLKRYVVPSVNLPEYSAPDQTSFVSVCDKDVEEDYYKSNDEQHDPLSSENEPESDIKPEIDVNLEMDIKPEMEIKTEVIQPEVHMEPQIKIETEIHIEPETEMRTELTSFEPEIEIKVEPDVETEPELRTKSDLEITQTQKEIDIQLKKAFSGGATCAVAGCRNYRSKTGQSISYHRFPKDINLRTKWIEKCKRNEDFRIDTTYVCSIHFTADDFERDLKNELLGLPLIKKLKKTAVPSMFLYSEDYSTPSEESCVQYKNLAIAIENDLETLRHKNNHLREKNYLLEKKYKFKIRKLERQIKFLQTALAISQNKSV